METYSILKQIISRISILEQTLISQTNAFYQMNSTYLQMVTFLQTICGLPSVSKTSLPQSFNFNSFEAKPFEFTLQSSLKMPQDSHNITDKKDNKIPFMVNQEMKEEDLLINYFAKKEEPMNSKDEQKVLAKQKTPSFGQMNEYATKLKDIDRDINEKNKYQYNYINENNKSKMNNYFISEKGSNCKSIEESLDVEDVSCEINPKFLRSNETFTNDIPLRNKEEILYDSRMNLTKSDKSIIVKGKSNIKEREGSKKKEKQKGKQTELDKDDNLLSKSMLNGKKLSVCSTKNKSKVHPVRKTIKLVSPQKDKCPQKLQVNIFQNKKEKRSSKKENGFVLATSKENQIVKSSSQKENANITSGNLNSVTIFSLPESCIIILFEFMGESISPLGFTCKMFLEFLSKSSLEIANCALQHLESEKNTLKTKIENSSKSFRLPKEDKDEYNSLTKADWEILTDGKIGERQSGKDIMILKLYLALMGKKFDYTSPAFLSQASKLFAAHKSQISILLDPNISFDFSPENIDNVRRLLDYLKAEQNETVSSSNLKVFDVMASIIIQAMQFAKLVPNNMENQLNEINVIEKQIDSEIQKLQRLLKIANHKAYQSLKE